ncbi:MFS transporter [Dictyobacter aurantiacus]|uniref:Tetracycline efflux MFS transporter TetA(P) n=1 Tax=Dictyobacter aurantiacus TaxID=1936993 RepID=A0A401ZDI7_9CHLR|nr:MFS transporter [Dictyobacter aurantiacus]GCE04915.1 tetracycline efflux MFS transporter TetA(P) [Dictyobacter aurantiacus]
MHFKLHKFDAFTIYLMIAGLGSFANSTIFSINMVYQIEAVRLNPLQLVLVGTAMEAACFIWQVPTGILADAYSRRLAVMLGYLLMGVGFLLEGLVPTFLAVIVANVLWGWGATFVTGAEEAWCADELGDERVGNAFIRGNQIGQVASLVSIPLGIWLATYRLNLPIIVGSTLHLLLAVLLYIWMPERNFQPIRNSEHNSWQAMGKMMADGGKAVRRSRMLLTILCITAFSAMASEGFDRLQTDHFIKNFAFPAIGHLNTLVWFGIISAGGSILCLIITELVRRRVHASQQRQMIKVMFSFQLLLIVSVVVFALSGNFYLALGAFWCASIGRSAASPFYMTWITRNSPPRMRATIISMFGQVDAIGQIAGGPAVGYIGTLVSLRAALISTSAILTPTIIFFWRALRLSKKTPVYSDGTEGEAGEAVKV